MYEALQEAQSCSASMDLVPRPSTGVAGALYIATQIAIIGKRIASGDTGVYNVCKNQVAGNYKTVMTAVLVGYRMKIISLTIVLIISLSGCTSNHKFTLSYSGLKFELPSKPVAVGVTNKKDNFLNDTGGCSYKDFFDEALDKQKIELSCGLEKIKSFRFVFMQDAEVGVWVGQKYNHYYFLRKNKTDIFQYTVTLS